MRHPAPEPPATKIAVVGGATCDTTTADLATQVGEGIADAGAILLCGGGEGVMAAAAAGARSRGGTTIGILPGHSRASSPPNAHIEVPLFTGIGQARNLVLVLSADAIIAVGGGWGTLSEISLAMKHGRPVALLSSWDLEFPSATGQAMPTPVATPGEAVRHALQSTASGALET